MFIALGLVLSSLSTNSVLVASKKPNHYKMEDSWMKGPYSPQEQELSYWREQAIASIREKTEAELNKGVAKNVILFLGDGMSIPTVTAARIYMGQLRGESGESSRLSFEKFPFTGLSKTYCVNRQVADSASTSTAYLSGVKANFMTLGVTAAVQQGDCDQSEDPKHQVDTILDWAQEAGKATGIVTGDYITGASPGGHYAHSANRNWESDYDMLKENLKADPRTCQDIARQLILNKPGKDVKVILGGGRSKFLPNVTLRADHGEGERVDGRDLIKEWSADKKRRGQVASFVKTRQELLALDLEKIDFLFGLFNAGGLPFHSDEGDETDHPSLPEMTEAAIRVLQKEKNGFYLFVESDKIDSAHHMNQARRALDETVELHKAVLKAMEMVDLEETLIVVTADHSHTLTMAGYPKRGNGIFGVTDPTESTDEQPYSTLSYANGPSASKSCTSEGYRDPSQDDYEDPEYQQPSLVPLDSETHGGDDVAVFAQGPWAHLLTGNYEQTLIPLAMAYAAEIGPYNPSPPTHSASHFLYSPHRSFSFFPG